MFYIWDSVSERERGEPSSNSTRTRCIHLPAYTTETLRIFHFFLPCWQLSLNIRRDSAILPWLVNNLREGEFLIQNLRFSHKHCEKVLWFQFFLKVPLLLHKHSTTRSNWFFRLFACSVIRIKIIGTSYVEM